MAVVTNEGGTTITPPHIGLVRLMALRGRLKLEIVGIKFRGMTTGSILKNEFGFKGNKARILEQLDALIDQEKERLADA